MRRWKAKGHIQELEKDKEVNDSGLWNVFVGHWDLVETLNHVYYREYQLPT
jgi:hypothetical protein